jgi:hypothetical protein
MWRITLQELRLFQPQCDEGRLLRHIGVCNNNMQYKVTQMWPHSDPTVTPKWSQLYTKSYHYTKCRANIKQAIQTPSNNKNINYYYNPNGTVHRDRERERERERESERENEKDKESQTLKWKGVSPSVTRRVALATRRRRTSDAPLSLYICLFLILSFSMSLHVVNHFQCDESLCRNYYDSYHNVTKEGLSITLGYE